MRYALIAGTLFPYQEKAPFVQSGKSVQGAIEVSSDQAKIKCHECGRWFRDLSTHYATHSLDSRTYKFKHGLRLNSVLAAPRTREMKSLSQLGRNPRPTPEHIKHMRDGLNEKRKEAFRQRRELGMPSRPLEVANLRANCRAQLTVRLTNLAAKLGHTPTIQEMSENGITQHAIRYAFRMTVAEALRAIGIQSRLGGRTRQVIAAPTELKILQMRANGASYRKIAAELEISRTTAMRHYNRPIYDPGACVYASESTAGGSQSPAETVDV